MWAGHLPSRVHGPPRAQQQPGQGGEQLQAHLRVSGRLEAAPEQGHEARQGLPKGRACNTERPVGLGPPPLPRLPAAQAQPWAPALTPGSPDVLVVKSRRNTQPPRHSNCSVRELPIFLFFQILKKN